MCLAVQNKIQSIEFKFNNTVRMAKVSFGGVIKETSLEMLPVADVGEIEKLNKEKCN